MEETKQLVLKKDTSNELDTLRLLSFEGVKRFKSIRRAIRRGLVSPIGVIYPKRPFNNRKNKPLEDKKRFIYEQIKRERI